MAVNIYNDVMQAENVVRYTTDAAYGVCCNVIVHILRHVHFRNERVKIADVFASQIVDARNVFPAV